MAERSAERYAELAQAFEMSCNPDTAQAFRDLAGLANDHAAGFGARAGPLPAWFDQAPEISDPDSVHYLMLPWHAFDLALRHETRILDYLRPLDGAETLAGRQTAHLAALTARRDACPQPHRGWWEDPDGPNWDGD